MIGKEKIWWLHPKKPTFSKQYFLALLLAEEHQLPVAPFCTNKQYESICKGKLPAVEKAHQKRARFNNQA